MKINLTASETAIENGPSPEQRQALEERIDVHLDLWGDETQMDPRHTTMFIALCAYAGGQEALRSKMFDIAVAAWGQDPGIDFARVIFTLPEDGAAIGRNANLGIQFAREYREPAQDAEVAQTFRAAFAGWEAQLSSESAEAVDLLDAAREGDGEE